MSGDPLVAYCSERQIPFRDRLVLAHLLLEADEETGVIDRFTLTHCSQEIGLGTSSGRRTLELRIRRLHKLGVLDYQPSAGGLPGTVTILDSGLLPTPEPRAKSARRGARSPREKRASRRAVPARKARVEIADTKEEDLNPGKSTPGTSKTASERETRRQIGQGKDWTDDDLDTILATLLDFCRRCGKQCIVTDRARVLGWLEFYSRRQLAYALTLFMPPQRKAPADKFDNPLGLFLSKARTAAPEYFAVPDGWEMSPGAAAGPSSFGRPLVDRSDLAERYGD